MNTIAQDLNIEFHSSLSEEELLIVLSNYPYSQGTLLNKYINLQIYLDSIDNVQDKVMLILRELHNNMITNEMIVRFKLVAIAKNLNRSEVLEYIKDFNLQNLDLDLIEKYNVPTERVLQDFIKTIKINIFEVSAYDYVTGQVSTIKASDNLNKNIYTKINTHNDNNIKNQSGRTQEKPWQLRAPGIVLGVIFALLPLIIAILGSEKYNNNEKYEGYVTAYNVIMAIVIFGYIIWFISGMNDSYYYYY